MAFDWTNIGTESLGNDFERNYRGYNVGNVGLLLHIRLRIPIPGASKNLPVASQKGDLENELYLPGDRVGTIGVPTWTQLKDEDLDNGVHRYVHATQTPGGNVIVRIMIRATMKVDRVNQTFYVLENYEVIENATLSGTTISSASRTGVISGTAAATYNGAATPVWQDLKVAPAGANLQLTVNAETGDDIEVNLVFSAYNSLGTNVDVDVRVILNSTEVCWCRNMHGNIGDDHQYCMGGRLTGLASASYTLKGQIYIPGEFVTITQHYGTARCKLEYRLIRG